MAGPLTPVPESECSSPVLDYLQEIHRKFVDVNDGAVATYIPELAKANPDWFGVSLVTTGGEIYEVGDSRQLFTIQSISKPFVYGLALEDNTRAEVLTKVGVEPTGDAFNAISLEAGTGRPRNPMINAGAIASAGMVEGKTPIAQFQRILRTFSLYAGRELSLDESVYRSESETGHRNRAIGHMLRNFNILSVPPEPIVDVYFKQCSISVNCRDLGLMAATLANGGINPVTNKQAIRGEYVESVLSVMASCGMYDYAGEWLYRIGMPAKSGVAGGIVAVLPGQLGIGIYSPRLDPRGNSVRGIKICDALSRDLNLHLFNTPLTTLSVIRARFSGTEVNSSRRRTALESKALREAGASIQAYQLQGNLVFSTAEVLVRDVLRNAPTVEYLILDLKRILGIDESACRLFHELLLKLSPQKKVMVFTGVKRHPALRRYMKAKLGPTFDREFLTFDEYDAAMEWCENQLLSARFPEVVAEREREATPDHYELFQGLDPDEIQLVSSKLQRQNFRAGDVLIQSGAAAREVFFLSSGFAVATVTLPDGGQKRLGVFSPGMSFGEIALLDGAPRSACVMADTDVTCDFLALEDFEKLGQTHPRIKIVLLKNMALGLARLLRKANREISLFN